MLSRRHESALDLRLLHHGCSQLHWLGRCNHQRRRLVVSIQYRPSLLQESFVHKPIVKNTFSKKLASRPAVVYRKFQIFRTKLLNVKTRVHSSALLALRDCLGFSRKVLEILAPSTQLAGERGISTCGPLSFVQELHKASLFKKLWMLVRSNVFDRNTF